MQLRIRLLVGRHRPKVVFLTGIPWRKLGQLRSTSPQSWPSGLNSARIGPGSGAVGANLAKPNATSIGAELASTKVGAKTVGLSSPKQARNGLVSEWPGFGRCLPKLARTRPVWHRSDDCFGMDVHQLGNPSNSSNMYFPQIRGSRARPDRPFQCQNIRQQSGLLPKSLRGPRPHGCSSAPISVLPGAFCL